ncbi:MAG: type III-A CRISPR-associated protein Cas10/Csm1 [Chloroflexota bacterium]|nr:type III-A CRISPR-associated protein Cas10/Csm1 [Chloroflexota bacterium]MBI5702585.1 type III-A CRISPR-associated protein Cas10/Csm1 [Chloroflexota bacterium]
MEGNDKVFLAALAGLLHDVGKVEQRAAERGSLESKDAAQMYGHYHAMLTADFLKDILPFGDEVRLPAANHHVPQSHLDCVVKAADVLSAGERAPDSPQGTDDRAAQPRQLLSIFSVIDADKVCWKNDKTQWRFFPLEKLALREDVIFPGAAMPDDGVWGIYEKLWGDFKKEAEALKPVTALEAYLEAMLALLQRYGWCMPSAYYRARPDVSLYDHSRMTAALAACLVDFSEEKLRQIAKNAETDETEVALLVGGDISGVQDFIYTITNKGATSALRGRSFYLQLLTDAAARFVLRELGLPITNLIYGGGGNFYILARATDAGKLPALRQKLSRILYKHHQGDLYIAIEGISLKAKDFMRPQEKNPDGTEKRHPLSDKWGDLARALAVVKNQRFAELDADELQVLFQPQGHGGNEETQCVVCGREYTPGKQDEQDEKDKGKCPACLSYETLGRDLRDAQYISWKLLDHPKQAAPIKADVRGGMWWKILNNLGFDVRVWDNLKEIPKDASWVWALSDDAFEDARTTNAFPVLIRRLLVNVTPKLSEPYLADDGQAFQTGDIKPFEKLAKDSHGITRLGIFRADVDNLGKLFAEGLGNDATLSRIASLSFSISLFFEGWMGKVAETWNGEHGDRLYAIYSGGDDLFFVGSWDEVVEFGWQVNEDLKKYTGGHPGIHISGGMALVTAKYPLAKAAKDAEKAEKDAKSLTWWDEEAEKAKKPKKKNVFAFLGQPLPWHEFSEAKKLKERLEKLEDSKRTAVIRKLLMNYALYAKAEKKRREKGKDKKQDGKPQTLYGPWNWRILYLLRRTFGKDSEKADPNEQTLINDFHTRPDMLEYTGVAARWVELLKRDSQEKE